MTVNFHIKTKNMDLTPDVSAQVHEKLSVVEKFLSPVGDQQILAEVEVGLDSKHHQKGDVYRAEANVSVDGAVYRAAVKAETITAALDNLKDEISKVIRRSQSKKDALYKRGGRMIKKLFTGK